MSVEKRLLSVFSFLFFSKVRAIVENIYKRACASEGFRLTSRTIAEFIEQNRINANILHRALDVI